MPKYWTEPLDPNRHLDHFGAGGARRRRRKSGTELAYFVRIGSFTFEFASPQQVRDTLEFLGQAVHSSSRKPVFGPEKGEWQAWHERLPAQILKSARRQRVVKVLREALAHFEGLAR